jgi:predicted nuclease of predicted toxin-antitoxin system
MARTIRFHLDEHCATALAEGLRRLGIDVTTTPEAGLLSASDEEQAAWALSNGRTIFTQDHDFLGLHALGVPHAGIVYCRQHTLSLGRILSGLELVWEALEPESMHNKVEYL